MDFSKHVKDKVATHYAYYEYEELPEKQRKAQKGELQCYDCHAPTYFTRSSKNGSQAKFSIMPGEKHEGNCEEVKKTNEGATKRRKREEKHYVEAVEKIQNDTGEIKIDSTPSALFEKLEGKDKEKPKSKKTPSKSKPRRTTGKAHVISSDQIRASRKNLVQLLKFCLYSSKFLKGAGVKLNFKGRDYQSNQRIKQFFQAGSITNTRIPYFFYGSIRNINDNLEFIYIGSKETKVIIDKSIHNQFWNALEVDKHWQLLGAQMICFGWLNRNQYGKTHVRIKNISDIAIIDIKENARFKPHVTTEPKNILLTENGTTKISEMDEANKEYAAIEQHDIRKMLLTENGITEIDKVDEANEEHAVIEQHDMSYDESGFIDAFPENIITHSEDYTEVEDVVMSNETFYLSTNSDYTKKKLPWLSSILSFFRKK